MFKYILLAVLFCLSLESKSINLDVSSYVFHGAKNYAELYLRVDAKSVQWSIIDGKNEAAVEFLIFITNIDFLSTIIYRFQICIFLSI